MERIPKISESEWQVMRVLWAKEQATANEVVDALADSTTWKPKTIKTMINRLVKKLALGFEKQGRAYLYYPLVDEAACVRAESRSFLRRVYGGSLTPMLVHFLEEEQLSPAEIEELRRILNERRE